MSHRESKIKVRDITVTLKRGGEGDPVLFLHGNGGLRHWLPFFDSMADGYEFFAPEHPGYDGSDDPPWIRNVPDVAMFYLDFLEVMNLRKVHIIGVSLGGWIAAEILVRDCSRAKSVTLVAPAGIRVPGIETGDLFIWNHEESVRNTYHDQSQADTQLAQQPTDEQVEINIKNRFTTTKLAWQPRMFNPDLEKWLHRIKVPALVVWGENDKLMPPAYAALWGERLPDARVVMIKDCGHLPVREKEPETSRIVRQFLKGVG